jgi:integrase
MREGLVDSNPVTGTSTHEEKSRERVLDDFELKAIWDATADNSDYSTIIRLLILTGQRRDEIAALRWSEIVGDEIRLPGSRTKNGRGHTVPLVPAARAYIDSRSRDGEFVFTQSNGQPFHRWSFAKDALDQRLGDKLKHWTQHDLRRTVATQMAEIGTPPHIVESLLNHVSGHKAGIGGIYNRANYAAPKRIALQKWADYVEALVSGKKSTTVVSLHA